MTKMYFEVKKYISEKHIFDIMNFFKEHNVNFNFKSYKSCKTLKLNIHSCNPLCGGSESKSESRGESRGGGESRGMDDETKKIKIKLNNNDYEARIYEYNDGYSRTINFVKIHAIYNKNNEDFNENDICGVIFISKDEKSDNDIANIIFINNGADCIKCFENKTFKIGSILMRIMICICVHKNIKKVQLTDNSYLGCANEKIPLIFLRTITHGKPYYTKFDFKPINHNGDNVNIYRKNELLIYKNNYDKYKKNPTIKKSNFIRILNYKKFDKETDKKMISYINNTIVPSLKDENIIVKDFVNELLKDKKKISCELLFHIIQNIYYACGYDKYDYKYFERTFSEKFINDIKKQIKIKNL